MTQNIAELMEWISGSYNVIIRKPIWVDKRGVVSAAPYQFISGTLEISRKRGTTFNGRSCVVRSVGVGLNGCAKTVTVSFHPDNYDLDLYELYTDEPVTGSSREEIARLVAGMK